MDDVLEIHFIEMNKFLDLWKRNELNVINDILIRWLLLLGMVDARKNKVYNEIYHELEALAMKDESISKEDTLAYESRLKYILDEEGKLDDVKYKAEKKGREEGLKEGKQEIVQNLLSMNIEMEVIQKATGLSVSQIEEI